ncbi:MAG TPA: sensor domain-containing diguanylate cyclase [Acidimicrobiales bacterium]|nr:sensor domain-containing diguanylate cyclase [Acidimicrobiales bacterium]
MTGGIQATGQGQGADSPSVAVGPGSDAMMRAIVQSSVNPYVILDRTGHVAWVSERIETLLGAPPHAYAGRHFLEMIDPSSHEAAIAEYSEFTSHSGDALPWIGPPMLLELVHADGARITCEVSAATGAGFGIDGIVVQIRRWRGAVLLHAAVDALAAGEPLPVVLRHLAAIAEHDMPGSAVVVAAGWDGTRFDVVEAAPITAREHPGLRAAVATAALTDWLPDTEGGNGLEPLAAAHGFATSWSIPVTVRGDHGPSGTLVLLRPLPGRPGPNHTTVERVASLVALAIESERNRQAWRRSALTDHLTDLPNRTGLEEWLAARAAATPDAPVAVLFCDVDEFKEVNDELGHAVGDRILQAVADRLRHSVRDEDLVARWGGDEFIVLCADPSAAEGLAVRLISHIEQPFGLDEGTATVGLSIGMAFGTFATPLDELLRTSDRALLEAKGQGRNRVVVSR